MAFTVTAVNKGVFGDLRYEILNVTLDTASGNIATGLQTIYGANIACNSMGTAGIMVKLNVGSGATSRAGYVNINSGAAGDNFVLTVYGK